MNAYAAASNEDLPLLLRIDGLLWALKMPAELRAASAQLGRRLLEETSPFISHQTYAAYSAVVARRETPGNGAVALGVVAQASNIPSGQAVLVLCHGHAVSLLGAAMRLMPLSHSDAQGILRRLHPKVAVMVEEIRGRSWEEMTSFTPALDISSMCHETDDFRLFAS